jgi:hypothetical protein
MDDPGLAWPFWKFGLKKDDLFTTLHDRYNTFASSIQDPEAFHHDVYEIATDASSTDDFHRRLADRKQRRLLELNASLESAAVEIIANPSLIGTAQWQYALQLFRTKSLDSLVRYFASYLPDDHPWHKLGSSSSDYESADESPISRSFFDEGGVDGGDGALLTQEPLSISTSLQAQLPPSPRSMTMMSDSSASAVDHIHQDYILHTLTPARTLSFSECDSDRFDMADLYRHHDDEASHSEPESPSTSVSDELETRSIDDADKDIALSTVVSETSITFSSSSKTLYSGPAESETPTPKPETSTIAASSGASSFFDAKPSSHRRRHRSCSPSRPHPLSQSQTWSQPDSIHKAPRTPRLRRRDGSAVVESGRRRSPGDALSRVHKPLPDDVTRHRDRRRRRILEC